MIKFVAAEKPNAPTRFEDLPEGCLFQSSNLRPLFVKGMGDNSNKARFAGLMGGNWFSWEYGKPVEYVGSPEYCGLREGEIAFRIGAQDRYARPKVRLGDLQSASVVRFEGRAGKYIVYPNITGLCWVMPVTRYAIGSEVTATNADTVVEYLGYLADEESCDEDQ